MYPHHKHVSCVKGSGLLGSLTGVAGKVLNRAIDILPVELHIPGYQYCGPGTKLKERLARGDPGINKLDSACKLHDIAYSKYSDSQSRAIADKELAERAWQRVGASDSSLKEKAAAWAVTNIMKIKLILVLSRPRNVPPRHGDVPTFEVNMISTWKYK